MPPKPKFTKEEIIATALSVAREKGIDAITAREMGARLKVSTRPVFTYFQSIEELKQAVYVEAREMYRRYIYDGLAESLQPQSVGLQFIRFAQEEPWLYRLIYFSGTRFSEENCVADAMYDLQEVVRPTLMKSYHMDENMADQYYRSMWLVVNSIAALYVTGSCPYTDTEIRSILARFSLSFCKALKEVPGLVDDSYDREQAFRKVMEA